jgi:hypothetical protein
VIRIARVKIQKNFFINTKLNSGPKVKFFHPEMKGEKINVILNILILIYAIKKGERLFP